MSNLFRKEVIKKQSQRNFGDVVLQSPFTSFMISIFIFIIALVLVLFIIVGEYSRKERVLGYLSPENGLVRIIPRRFGQIDSIFIKTGQQVVKNQKLFSIRTDTQNAYGYDIARELLNQLSLEKSELEKVFKLNSLKNDISKKRLLRQIEYTEGELNYISKRISLQERFVENERLILKKIQSLVNDQAVNDIDASIQENEFLEASQIHASLENEKEKLQEQVLDLREQLELFEVSEKREVNEINRELIAIERIILQTQSQEKYILESPISGQISSITANVGQNASAQRAIATIIPENDELIAHLLIPSRAAGLIKEGQTIRLLYDAFPYQKFGFHSGVVKDVSHSVVSSSDLEIAPSILEPVFLIQVKLSRQSITANGETYQLQAGMTLSADIILEERKIWEWIFEPILTAFSG